MPRQALRERDRVDRREIDLNGAAVDYRDRGEGDEQAGGSRGAEAEEGAVSVPRRLGPLRDDRTMRQAPLHPLGPEEASDRHQHHGYHDQGFRQAERLGEPRYAERHQEARGAGDEQDPGAPRHRGKVPRPRSGQGAPPKGPRKNNLSSWRPDVPQIWSIGEPRNRRNGRAISRWDEKADLPARSATLEWPAVSNPGPGRALGRTCKGDRP